MTSGATPEVRRLLFVLSGSPEEVGYGLIWADRLAQGGDDVTVALQGEPPAGAPRGRARLVDLRGRGTLASIRALRSGIRRWRPTAIVAVSPHANLRALAAAALSRGRTTPVLTVDVDLRTPLVAAGGVGARMRDLASRVLYRRAAAAVSGSHAVAAESSARFAVRPSRSLVVPPPVLSDEGPATAPRSPSEAGLSILLTDAAAPQSRAHLAVETAFALAGDGERVEIVTLTDAAPAPVRDLAARLDVALRHQPHGLASDVPEGAVLLLATAHEGFAGVLVDAAARGIPSVAVSSALGVAEAIVPGVTGELSLDDDPETLADAVRAARRLPPGDAADWLDRFRAAPSSALLDEAIEFARRTG